jgi:hypothetical protein
MLNMASQDIFNNIIPTNAMGGFQKYEKITNFAFACGNQPMYFNIKKI